MSPLFFLCLRPGEGHPEEAAAGPAQPQAMCLSHCWAEAFIRRACSQERWHLFNIPSGFSSCSLDAWQEPYLYSRSKFILSILLEIAVITFKSYGKKTNYIAQRLSDEYIIHLTILSMAKSKHQGSYRSMDVEVLVPWCKDVLEGLLVLRCGCPRWVRRWSGDHHEERFRVGLVVQEVQGDISLTYTKICHLLPYPIVVDLIHTRSLMNRRDRVILALNKPQHTIYVIVKSQACCWNKYLAFRQCLQ